MNTPEQVRSKVAAHAERFTAQERQADKSVTWEIIHRIENAWRDRTTKERTSNRRAVLLYCFGVDSTKSLTHGQILALRQWTLFSPDAEAELHAVLEARLLEAGQLPMPVPLEPEQRERMKAALWGYEDEQAASPPAGHETRASGG
jgi:hypothetical protein